MSTSLQTLIQNGIKEWTTTNPSTFQSIRYVSQEQDGIQMIVWKYDSSAPLYASFYIQTQPIQSTESPYQFNKPVYVTNAVQDFIDFLRYQVSINWTYVGSCILPPLTTPFLDYSIYKSIAIYFDLDDSLETFESSQLTCRFISAV